MALSSPLLGVSTRLGRPLRVLIVDDDRDTVQTLGILFRSEGAEVCLLDKSTRVVATAQGFQPDIVLLDIGMPDRNGYEVAEDLRKQFGDRSTIVAVTAYSGLADKCQARVSGFDHYIEKPYDPLSVLDFVAKMKPR